MAFKFVAVLAFVTIASAGYIPPQQPFYKTDAPAEHSAVFAPPQHQGLEKKVEEYDPHPQYKFAYNVDDATTGDSKSHSETRNGDQVEGEYSLIDADGFKRIVHYTVDSKHGFNAVVTRVPLHGADHHEVGIKNSHVTYTAPTVAKTVQPAPYGSSSNYYKPAPIHYTAPATIDDQSVKNVDSPSNGSPNYYKTESIPYAPVPNALKTTGPVLFNAPSQYKSAPVAQIHPTAYVQARESNSGSGYNVKSSPHYQH